MRYARIKGTGIYLPKKAVSNEELSRIMEVDVEKYLSEKGIKVRYVSGDETPSHMATKAAEKAMGRAGIGPQDVDLIIVATDTPDYITPPTSPIVQEKLGAKKAGAFDINAACADETIALSLGSHYIMLDDSVNNVLVIGVYSMTKWLDWRRYSQSASKALATLFGDGAGCIVLSASNEPGYLTSRIVSEGSFWDTYGIYLGSASPPTEDMLKEGKHFLRFHENRHRVPKDYNPTRWSRIIRETAEKAGIDVSNISLILFNQISMKDIEDTLLALSLPADRTHMVMDRFGYAGSASAIMALHDALEEGKIKKGDYVMFCTSGAGFVVASSLFRWV